MCHRHQVNPAAPLAAVSEWVRVYERFWEERLDALAELARNGDLA